MKRLVLGLVVVAACKGSPAEDWTVRPTKAIDASTGGVPFSITLPEDWQPRTPPDHGWGPTTGDSFKRPSADVQNVSLDFASSLQSAIDAAGAKPEKLVRKDQRSDGYALTEVHGKTLVRVTVFKKTAGSYLWCTASQANDDGLTEPDHVKTALQKICDSVAPK